MNGIELAEKYYKTYGESAFSSAFPEILPFLCFGLSGAGSECYGFDDEISRDHDFEPGFCVFYPEDKLDSRQVFALERAYAKLPADFMGLSRQKIASYGGVRRRGVIGVNEFFSRYVPGGAAPSDLSGWASIPEQNLCEALNGRVFADYYGLFSSVRASLADMPEDIKKKRLSGLLFAISQSGWYDALRMLQRGDTAASRLFLAEFARDAARCVYILNGRYSPYMKWLIRGLKELPSDAVCSEIHQTIEKLLNVDVSSPAGSNELTSCLRTITEKILTGCENKYGCGLSDIYSAFDNNENEADRWIRLLQRAAFSLNDMVSDNYLRNSDILLLV